MTELSLEIKTDDIMKFTDRFSLGRDRGLGSRQFLRIKVPGGVLTSEQLRAFAQLSDRFGRGYAEMTDRQDIQLHWIKGKEALEIFAELDRLGFNTDRCGQSFPGARFGDVRNIVVCPVTGVNKNELIDVAPLAKRINDFFNANPEYIDLPRKFKISITGCELGCTRPEMQDLGLFAIKYRGKIGFAAIVGGSLGSSLPGPRLGKPLGVFIRREEVFDVVKSMVDLFKEHGNREIKIKSRFKWLVETWGLEKIRDELERKLGRKLERLEHGNPPTSGEEHVGVQEQKNGKYFICVPVYGGIIPSAKLKNIADIAGEFGKGEIRTTPYQNFVLPHVPGGELNAALRRLADVGLPVEGSPLRWTTVGCAADFCGKSVEPHPKQVVQRVVESLEKRFGEKFNGLKLNIHISGCMHDCGIHRIGHIGILCVKVASGGGSRELYTLSVGGELGEKNAFANPIKKMLALDALVAAVELLVEACISEGFKDFGEFCRAHELKDLKSIVSKEGN